MICELLKRDVKLIFKSVIRFLDISVTRAMGCFFGCFRVSDDRNLSRRRNLAVSNSSRPEARNVLSNNRLSALFLSEESEDIESSGKRTDFSGSPKINKELVDEAKFLKACGTLPETPSEIRRAAEKLRSSPPTSGHDSKSSDYHSWLPNTSVTKLQLDKKIDQSLSPVKLSEEWENSDVSSEQKLSSCTPNVQNTGRTTAGPGEDAECVPYKNRSVRFECNFDTSSSKGSTSDSGRHNSCESEFPGEMSVSKRSPKPTPFKLSDEMQTPGTVFPASVEAFGNGKARIRSQYVHPVSNPVENASQWKLLQEEDYSSQQDWSVQGSLEQLDNYTPKQAGAKGSLTQDLKVEASLSSWLKPVQKDGLTDRNTAGQNFRFGRTPMDRPIIGMVAAHWNENEPTEVSPKWWDGNGIPNSTTKYKEDQKVSWHATPFEERLEKALSEESLISQKKPVDVGGPIVFDEHDESDTALSKFQAAANTKSVVSF